MKIASGYSVDSPASPSSRGFNVRGLAAHSQGVQYRPNERERGEWERGTNPRAALRKGTPGVPSTTPFDGAIAVGHFEDPSPPPTTKLQHRICRSGTRCSNAPFCAVREVTLLVGVRRDERKLARIHRFVVGSEPVAHDLAQSLLEPAAGGQLCAVVQEDLVLAVEHRP